jgi:hypothetical protein
MAKNIMYCSPMSNINTRNKYPILAGAVLLALTSTACNAKPAPAPAVKQVITQTLRCPAALSATTALPAGAILVGSKPQAATALRGTGLMEGTEADAKSGTNSEEIIDEWDDLPDGTSQSVVVYERNQSKMMLYCAYGFDKKKPLFMGGSTAIFLPIKANQYTTCTFRQLRQDKRSAECVSRK